VSVLARVFCLPLRQTSTIQVMTQSKPPFYPEGILENITLPPLTPTDVMKDWKPNPSQQQPQEPSEKSE
jgi:hypothetical protein